MSVGDCNLKIASPNNGREVKVAEGRIIDRIAEDAFFSRFLKDSAVHGGNVRRGHDEKAPCQVSLSIRSAMVLNLSRSRQIQNPLTCLGSDDRDLGVCSLQRFDLGLGQVSSADDDARAGGKLEEDGEERHSIFL